MTAALDKPVNKAIADRKTAILWMLLFFILGAVAVVTTCVPSANGLDYAISLLSGLRTAHGQKPYADFAVLYGPLGHYLSAAWLLLFSWLMPATAMNILYMACSLAYLALVWWSTRLLRRAPISAIGVSLAAYLVLTTPLVTGLSYYSMLPCLLLLLGIIAADRVYESGAAPNLPWEIVLGLLVVATTLLRFNFGIYLLLATAATSALDIATRRQGAWPRAFRLLVIGSLLGVLAAAVLWLFGILVPHVSDLIVYLPRFKNRNYPLRLVPRGDLVKFAVLAVATVAAAFYFLEKRGVGAAFFTCILIVSLLHYLSARFDAEHATPLLVMIPLLVAFAIPNETTDEEDVRCPVWLGIRPVAATILCLLMVTAASLYWLKSARILKQAATWCLNRHTTDPALVQRRGVYIDRVEADLLDDLDGRLAPRETIYWGGAPGSCESTSHIGVNMNMYVASGRLPTTRIWFWDTPSTIYPEVQQKIVDDLESQRLPWVGVEGSIDPSLGYIPGNPREASVFYEYVQKHYELVKRVEIPEKNRFYVIYHRMGIF